MIVQLAYKFLALLITIGVFTATGFLPYPVVGYTLILIFIFIYVTTDSTEDMLFRILFLLTAYFTATYVFTYSKEGFYITPSKLMSHSMTAKQCQDICESNKHCKFSNVPVGSSNSGRKLPCYNSYGQNQKAYGSQNQGGDTWQNKKYVPPPPPPPPPKPRLFKNGQYISIRNYRGQWLAADPRGRHDQVGFRNHRITWETFQVLHHPNGNRDQYLIKSIHGKYLIFNSSLRIGPWFRVYFHNFGNRRPSRNWKQETIEFKKKSNGKWGIYNPYHKRYMNSYTAFQSLAVPWHGRHEEFKLYKVPTVWGRGSREWNDKPLQKADPCRKKYNRLRDYGYSDRYRGWYDIDRCGKANAYCRWVGNSGSGGNPKHRTTSGASWWSCAIDNTHYTRRKTFGNTFNFQRK